MRSRHAISRLACVILFSWGAVGTAAGQDDAAAAATKLPPEQLEQLLAPIALYPDMLLAQMLPATTFPMDVVMAARWLRSNPDMKTLTDQPWDPSVLSLCNYPQSLYKLDENLDWTNAVGAAFLDQPQDVMNAIQQLRAEARASGALQTTRQQTIVMDQDAIRIVPSDPQVIYVPAYNPAVVYVEGPGVIAASAISFTAGLAMGAWLDMDCDWRYHHISYCRPGYWGGYAYVHPRGGVAWGDDWAAAVGRRRAAVFGEHGGAYVGPRGGAVWGDNGYGAAWTRGYAAGRPVYTGAYSKYRSYPGNVAQVNRNQAFSNNRQYNYNQNNINIDRGDRATVARGNKAIVNQGNRANVRQGDSTFTGRNEQTAVGRGDVRRTPTPGTMDQRPSGSAGAFSPRNRGSDVRASSERGQASREGLKGTTPSWSSQPRSGARPSTSTPGSSSAFSRSQPGGDARNFSNRGAASRGGGSRGGGGRR
jgi:uncharacterized membrane protein YgcG